MRNIKKRWEKEVTLKEYQETITPHQLKVKPLIPHLPKTGLFAEPCAGDGRLIRHIEQLSGMLGYWMTDMGFDNRSYR